MTKKYCDKCKREIDANGSSTKIWYGPRGFEIDFCEDCKEGYWKFKDELHKKYDELYKEINKQELKELYEYLGQDIEGIFESLEEEGVIDDND